MDEFYSNIKSQGVSAATGEGIEELFGKVLTLYTYIYVCLLMLISYYHTMIL
jgi:hypothetical protein